MLKQALKYYIFGIVVDSFFDRLIREFTPVKFEEICIRRVGYELGCYVVCNNKLFFGEISIDYIKFNHLENTGIIKHTALSILDCLYTKDYLSIYDEFYEGDENGFDSSPTGHYAVTIDKISVALRMLCESDPYLKQQFYL